MQNNIDLNKIEMQKEDLSNIDKERLIQMLQEKDEMLQKLVQENKKVLQENKEQKIEMVG